MQNKINSSKEHILDNNEKIPYMNRAIEHWKIVALYLNLYNVISVNGPIFFGGGVTAPLWIFTMAQYPKSISLHFLNSHRSIPSSAFWSLDDSISIAVSGDSQALQS